LAVDKKRRPRVPFARFKPGSQTFGRSRPRHSVCFGLSLRSSRQFFPAFAVSGLPLSPDLPKSSLTHPDHSKTRPISTNWQCAIAYSSYCQICDRCRVTDCELLFLGEGLGQVSWTQSAVAIPTGKIAAQKMSTTVHHTRCRDLSCTTRGAARRASHTPHLSAVVHSCNRLLAAVAFH